MHGVKRKVGSLLIVASSLAFILVPSRISSGIDECREILDLVYRGGFELVENLYYCNNPNTLGYTIRYQLVICTNNVKESGLSVHSYINETITHEAVHVAHICNAYMPFYKDTTSMSLENNKESEIRASMAESTASYQMEHEAYWMENKPEKVIQALRTYCGAKAKPEEKRDSGAGVGD